MAFFGYHLLKKPDTPNGKLIALYLFEQNLPEATEFYVRDDGVLYVHWEIKKLRGFEVNNEKLLRTAKEEIMSMLCDVVHKYFPESLVGPRHDETRIVFGGGARQFHTFSRPDITQCANIRLCSSATGRIPRLLNMIMCFASRLALTRTAFPSIRALRVRLAIRFIFITP